jgi:hypothetical protein
MNFALFHHCDMNCANDVVDMKKFIMRSLFAKMIQKNPINLCYG